MKEVPWMMKLAFCFLTLDNVFHPGVWEQFFAAASPEHRTVYCHPKLPERVTNPLLKDRVIAELVETSHGHISQVEAVLALFRAAYHDDPANEYFILLSESTIPIASFARIHAELAQSGQRSLIPYHVPQVNSEHHLRLRRVSNPALFAKAFYWHDNWVILHRRHVAALLERSFFDLFARVFGADEHYFMNTLVHLLGVSTDEVISRRTTFVNWREPERRITADAPKSQVMLHNWENPEKEKAYLANPDNAKATIRTTHPKTYTVLTPADLAEAHGMWFFRKVAAACNCDLVLPRLRATV
jgi:hypothetical protein